MPRTNLYRKVNKTSTMRILAPCFLSFPLAEIGGVWGKLPYLPEQGQKFFFPQQKIFLLPEQLLKALPGQKASLAPEEGQPSPPQPLPQDGFKSSGASSLSGAAMSSTERSRSATRVGLTPEEEAGTMQITPHGAPFWPPRRERRRGKHMRAGRLGMPFELCRRGILTIGAPIA